MPESLFAESLLSDRPLHLQSKSVALPAKYVSPLLTLAALHINLQLQWWENWPQVLAPWRVIVSVEERKDQPHFYWSVYGYICTSTTAPRLTTALIGRSLPQDYLEADSWWRLRICFRTQLPNSTQSQGTLFLPTMNSSSLWVVPCCIALVRYYDEESIYSLSIYRHTHSNDHTAVGK